MGADYIHSKHICFRILACDMLRYEFGYIKVDTIRNFANTLNDMER